MAYDEGLAQILRDDLEERFGVNEKRIFGGLCFMDRGNMLCGVHKGGAMFRVGKANEPEALSLEGASPMAFTGRKMGGLIDVSEEAFADDEKRAKWLALAFNFTNSLPNK